MGKSESFRRLLGEPGLIVAPGAYDGLTARLIEAAGFPLVYMSGYATAASYGYPDTGQIGFPEMLANAARLVDAVEIPVAADADTGYEDPGATTSAYESAGAAGIQIEDQVWPKKCGHMEGKRLVSTEEMCERIARAAAARKNIVIIARTDAIAVEGFDAAISRAERYAEAGADVLFVEAPEDMAQLEAIPKRLPMLPLVFNAAPRTPDLVVTEIERLGYKLAIFPGLALTANWTASQSALEQLRREGSASNMEVWRANFPKWNAFLSEHPDKF